MKDSLRKRLIDLIEYQKIICSDFGSKMVRFWSHFGHISGKIGQIVSRTLGNFSHILITSTLQKVFRQSNTLSCFAWKWGTINTLYYLFGMSVELNIMNCLMFSQCFSLISWDFERNFDKFAYFRIYYIFVYPLYTS